MNTSGYPPKIPKVMKTEIQQNSHEESYRQGLYQYRQIPFSHARQT